MRVQLHQPDRRSTAAGSGFTRLVAVLFAGLVIGLAGCGGSDEEDLTRTGYITDADAICAQFSAGSADLERQFNQALQGSDLEAASRFFTDQATEVTSMLDQLEELTPPVADQTTVDEIIALGRERVTVARQAADAIAAGDQEAMIAAGKKGSTLAGQYYQMADGFGFETCGSAGGVTPGGGSGGTTGTTGTTS